MECVFDILGASVATMAVKHSKDLDFGPNLNPRLLRLRLDNIQYNCNPVLIRFPYRADIRVSRKTPDCSKGLRAHFGLLELLQS